MWHWEEFLDTFMDVHDVYRHHNDVNVALILPWAFATSQAPGIPTAKHLLSLEKWTVPFSRFSSVNLSTFSSIILIFLQYFDLSLRFLSLNSSSLLLLLLEFFEPPLCILTC